MELQKIKHAGIITIPSLFTIGNICCGFFSILASISGNYARAGWLVFAAMALDAFDGRVARMLKAESAFGVEMDSLADLISFCAAPAFMIYFIALKGSTVWGAAIAFMFMLFGALRLAKFNVMAHAGKGSKQYFSGLPTPAAAAVLASFALSYNIFAFDADGRLLPGMHIYLPYIYNGVAFLTIGLALLMVSNIPYAAFKDGVKPAAGRRRISAAKLIGVVIVLALFFKYPQDIVFILFGSYALMGIIVMMFKAFRNIKERN
ncbi:MAG: CDP-diacylglycerol--serine O-phosphatidyltransferase [Elusimicrobiota bacterium]|jgi:CDP-diacylglycerol--serine O-phosphatidyltransferase|nr:CDP-diacylglycerol--serine O-phosphatidyltransferase [Elusimicrobiota bacterium]